nr:DUF6694 family lipoprotein [Fischerella sp. PCC 9605]
MKSSIEKVRQSLPEDKRGEFDEALSILYMSQMRNILTQGMPLPIYPEQKLKELINGKTGLEIIASAEDIKRKLQEERKKHILQEIKKLEEKKHLPKMTNFSWLNSKLFEHVITSKNDNIMTRKS